jgi:aspartyl/glutamyl-tRNA(Asn/Gln) amidotransferase, C subunit
MERKDKEFYQALARQLMFELSDEEAEEVKNEFTYLLEQLELLEKVDTDGVEEMIYPFEDEVSYIRRDEIGEYLSQEEALKNAKKVKQGMVLVPKVVK